ncbi:hypothetical protein BY996DRAFT_6418587 [Phakopsora pachyrhizi]|nr:hypothetical protein BY996DRAFT_6418587 [Phakopsora pachyrhizi]
MAKAFESAENTPSSSHFSLNHQTSNQISEHLLPERQPPFLNNLGPVAATNPSAPLLYEYSEHSRLSKDLSEYIVQSQEQCLYYLKLALARLRGGQSLHLPVSEKPEPPTNESGGGNHINAGSSEYTAAANASSYYPSQEIKQELSSFVDQEFSEGTLLPHATGSLRTEGYYCITSSQKAFYLPQRNKVIIDVGSLFNNQSNVASASALAVSRLTRVNSRRFVVNMEQNKKASTLASASIDTVTDALKYSNSRFSLPSPAETVENLSSSALNKGLSLALERKISKSPCRTPPSRATASETNRSVPAANFSHLQALSNSGSALSERAFDDSENLSTKGENQNLSRKSRIKRQVSATIDPTQAGTYQQWSSMISLRDGYTSASSGNCLTSNWIPRG